MEQPEIMVIEKKSLTSQQWQEEWVRKSGQALETQGVDSVRKSRFLDHIGKFLKAYPYPPKMIYPSFIGTFINNEPDNTPEEKRLKKDAPASSHARVRLRATRE